MNEQMNVLVTGGEGYLGKQYVRKLRKDPHIKKIIIADPKNDEELIKFPHKEKTLFINGKYLFYWEEDNVIHLDLSVNNPTLLDVFKEFEVEIAAHFAWWFNPTYDLEAQHRLDIGGTNNFLSSAALSGTVKHIVYTGSSTAYGQIRENDHPLKEEEWEWFMYKRLAANYLYSRHKAEADLLFQRFQLNFPQINVFWTRAAIVLGKNTPSNIVAYVAKSPFTFGKYMFKVKDDDPQMQFLSERDITEVLYRATMERWSGPVNVAGTGTLPYSEVIKLLGRKQIELPAKALYCLCGFGWKWHFLKFPPSLIDLIRYPWVGNINQLRKKHGYEPRYSSVDALLQFKESLL